jgi:PRD domain protein (TIGR03582 family)
MHMTEQIIQAVEREIELTDNERNNFITLLEAALAAAKEIKLIISEERLLRLGIHLIAVIRRAENGERLPPVDEVILQQVASDMQELARKVLGAASVTTACQTDSTEVLLLAVHFAAARESM